MKSKFYETGVSLEYFKACGFSKTEVRAFIAYVDERLDCTCWYLGKYPGRGGAYCLEWVLYKGMRAGNATWDRFTLPILKNKPLKSLDRVFAWRRSKK
jgi:hypothetical protein